MALKYHIYIQTYDKKTKVEFPVLPSQLPEVSYSSESEDFSSTTGQYTIIGQAKMAEIDVEALVPDPSKKLSFCVGSLTGAKLVSLLRGAQNSRVPIRYMVTKSSGGNLVNSLFQVIDFSWKIDKKNDYIVSMSLKGWRSYKNWKSGSATNGIVKKTLPKLAVSKVIALNLKTLKLKKGKTKQLRLKNASGKITWKSSKKKIASVSKKGKVKAKKKGTCKVYAIYKKKKYACKVTVKK